VTTLGKERGVQSPAVAGVLALVLVLVVTLGTWAPVAHADSQRDYVAKLVLVLDGVRRAASWVEANPGNQELARFAHDIVEHYVQLAGRMIPPPELRLAHPHLLIVVENAERAVAAAAENDARAYRTRSRTLREELRTLEGVLEHLHVRLPPIPR